MDSLTTTENKSERVLLGTVGVDTGQLFISDPSYIEHQWTPFSKGELLSIKFWGQACEKVKTYLEKEGYSISIHGGACYIDTPNNTDLYESLKSKIHHYATSINEVIVCAPHTTSTYDSISNLTLSDKGYGQTTWPYGVAFTSGLGDGRYNVYGTIQDVKGWGERITKVEIELIPDELIVELEAVGKDHV
ncbi:hypothetical protein P4I89_08165 [Bacillus cereus]|uniref:hypothetical protein n=1 Tax=Bacillus thuringiensis TaxID=1428 RepID=UPI0024BBEF2E|nr:hypothetical protein [Bacillus thuringiensis]MDR5047842.1 hypothetical protein [Bacillus thuringiensis]MEB9509471.1 hypothetical protein [Bacillus cereus]